MLYIILPQKLNIDNIHDVSCKVQLKSFKDSIKIIEMIKNKKIKKYTINQSGKLFLKKDFKPEHLRIIYNLYNDDIVKMFLKNKLKKQSQKQYQFMINIGIIGCGRIATHHCEAIKKINGLNLTAVCDLYYKKLKIWPKNLKQAYKNYHEMLKEKKEINLVIIITPSGMHYEHTVDIIQNYKKNIVVEKPTFLKSEEVEKVYKLAKKIKLNYFLFFKIDTTKQ